MKKARMVKAAVFCVLFVILFGAATKIVSAADYRNYQWIAGFYEEREASLDAVYIGSSNCYAFWNSVAAWEEYGIAVYPYTCNAQPFEAAEYLMKETRKTQPDAVFIVNLNTITDGGEISVEQMHYLLDYMPLSRNKLALTNFLADKGGYSLSERLEFYFPIIRYHARWNELQPEDFAYEVDGLKGTIHYASYLKKSVDLSESYNTSGEKTTLPDGTLETLDGLLDYCDTEKIRVLFVAVPQARNDEDLKTINALAERISERGYDVLSLLNTPEQVGLDLKRDFYNERHTNIHGSIKFTQYLSEYLVEHYGFQDKRGREDYRDWDEAYERYAELMAPYVLDFELDPDHRAYDLSAPASVKATAQDRNVTLTWKAVEGADGYAIYRKGASWEQIAQVDGQSYSDEALEDDTTYVYTVVPFYETDGEKYYGHFSYSGKKVEISSADDERKGT